MNEQELRTYIRTQLLKEEGEQMPPMGAEVNPEEEKEKEKIQQNRKDEIIDTIRHTFFVIKNDSEIIKRYRELYQKLHTNNEESKASFLNVLQKMIRDKFLFLFRMVERDVEAAKLFEKDTVPVINDEMEKAFINLKDRITN